MRRLLSRRNLAVLVALGVVAFIGWLGWNDEPIGIPMTTGAELPGSGGALALEQGWSAHTLERAWHTSFGSALLNRRWFLALERPDGTGRFSDDAHLRSFGFLPQAANEFNPDGLPIGLAATGSSDEAQVGFTCAACHTGELRIAGNRLRIAGGSGMLDIVAFENTLLLALQSTATDSSRFERFATRVGDAGNLRQALVHATERLARRVRINHVDVAYGPGRMDAFGQIFNAVSSEFLGLTDNHHSPDAPVSIPSLWNTPRLDRVQWNGSSPNSDVAPLVQNATTALAVYGDIDLAHPTSIGYHSSVDITALGRLQSWNTRLRSPQWPEALLGALDRDAMSRGRDIYTEQCAECHVVANRNDQSPLSTRLVPLAEIGTDPRMADNFVDRQVDASRLTGEPAMVWGGHRLAARTRAINLVVHAALGATLQHPLLALRAAWAGRSGADSAAASVELRAYKAAPLAGVWSTAPYLHNGSVPTLLDLLRQPQDRPASFNVGGFEFDPVKVGLAEPTHTDPHHFDTRQPGNSNAGHLYGTQLTEAQRGDLLEYLKSL